jgi:hypothetical protein
MSDPQQTVDLSGPEAAPPVPADVTLPQRVGRYRIEGVLGQGGSASSTWPTTSG